MLKRKRDNRLIGIAWAVLIVFGLYYSNISLFQHCHIINGVTIVHSHFHGEGHHTNQSGNHTTSELTLMAHNAQFESVESVSEVFDFSPCQPLLALIQSNLQAGHSVSAHPYFSLRAPPVLC